MGWLTEGLKGLQSDVNKSGAVGDFFTNTGGSITDAYKTAPGSDSLKRTFYDPSRDSGYNALKRIGNGLGYIGEGKNPFLQEAGDVEYNQNMAKRAAIVAAVFGGVAAGGAYGASSAAEAAAANTMAGGGAGAGAASGTGAASTAPAWAGPAATSAAPGSFAAMGETVGATGTGLGASGGIGAGATPGTYGAMAAGSAVPGGSIAAIGGGAAAPAAAAPAAGSWAPYAQAGGSILSTLFSGLLSMEKDREANIQSIRAKQAETPIKRAEAQNQALDRLIQVWRH